MTQHAQTLGAAAHRLPLKPNPNMLSPSCPATILTDLDAGVGGELQVADRLARFANQLAHRVGGDVQHLHGALQHPTSPPRQAKQAGRKAHRSMRRGGAGSSREGRAPELRERPCRLLPPHLGRPAQRGAAPRKLGACLAPLGPLLLCLPCQPPKVPPHAPLEQGRRRPLRRWPRPARQQKPASCQGRPPRRPRAGACCSAQLRPPARSVVPWSAVDKGARE